MIRQQVVGTKGRRRAFGPRDGSLGPMGGLNIRDLQIFLEMIHFCWKPVDFLGGNLLAKNVIKITTHYNYIYI